MLKLIGCGCILVASFGGAYSIYLELKQHLQMLYELRSLLTNIFWETAYSMQPLEVVLLYQIRTKDERLLHICKEIGTRLLKKEAQNGSLVWQECFRMYRKELGLKEEEGELIEQAGSAYFGKSMEENQKGLAFYLERLDAFIETERKERREKQKVYQTVCIMSGLVLIILFV